MRLYFRRAIQDIRNNRFLNTVTIITISLSILIVSAFMLFFINASTLMNLWREGVRIVVYLKDDIAPADIPAMQSSLLAMYGVSSVEFISKETALEQLKTQMKRQSSILENLSSNPLPDTFEIRMIAASQNWEKAEELSKKIELLPMVEEVEYGQRWLEKFSNIYSLFRLAGYTMGALFLVAAIFIVANTIRLLLYSRREEVEIMRLVGATDFFVKAPFYIESLIQGALGGGLGLGVLFLLYLAASSNVASGVSPDWIRIQFLPPQAVLLIFASSLMVGWLGCYLALKQYMKAQR